MASRVQLTGGEIDATEMGRTLIHEHIISGMPGWQWDLKAPKFVRAEGMAHAVDKLQKLKDFGCATIVDPCPMDLGRDVEFVAEASQRSGVNIICATGVYFDAEGIAATFRKMPRDEILAFYCREITEGIGDTGIKAGVVKIATGDQGHLPYETKMIGVAAEASRITGVPIISHTPFAKFGHEQLDIVMANGGRADCMVVGHSGDRDDVPYQRSLAQRDTFVGLDRFGLDMILPDEIRIRNLMQLVTEGFVDHVVVSHDHCLCLQGRLASIYETLPNWTMTHLFERVFPQMIEMGLSSEDLDTILVRNPKRLFTNAVTQLAVESPQLAFS